MQNHYKDMFFILLDFILDLLSPYSVAISTGHAFYYQLTIDHNPVIVLVVILQSASFAECYSAVELIAANVMEWENALDMQLKVWFFYLLRTRCYLKV